MTQVLLCPKNYIHRSKSRNGRALMVLGLCRISTAMQDRRSLEDQEALYRGWLDEHIDEPDELSIIASQGSGECLDREEYQKAIGFSCLVEYHIT